MTQNAIAEVKKDLPNPKREMDQIHADMKNTQAALLKQLEETEAYGMK